MISNIKAYLQGNIRLILSKLDGNSIFQFVALKPHLREQVAYRMDVCEDSCKTKCKHCECSTPGKWFADKECGSGKYPNMMDEKEWIKYKEQNGINL